MNDGDAAPASFATQTGAARAGAIDRSTSTTRSLLVASVKKWALGWTVTFLGGAMFVAVGALVFWPLL